VAGIAIDDDDTDAVDDTLTPEHNRRRQKEDSIDFDVENIIIPLSLR